MPKTSSTRQLCGINFTSSALSALIYSSSSTPHAYIFKCIYIYNEAQAAPELVQGPPAMKAKSCVAMALLPRGDGTGGQVRQKGWKKADPFQEQKAVFRVSSCFPTPSPASSIAPPAASPALLPKPLNCQGDGKRQGWGLLRRSKGGQGKGKPWRHPTRVATAGVS